MLTKAESALYGDKTKSYAFGLRTVAARKRALTKLVGDGYKKTPQRRESMQERAQRDKFIVGICSTALFCIVAAAFLSSPQKYMHSFFNGVTAWAYNVLPVLFPFALLTSAFRIFPKRSLSRALFGISADKAWFSSLICGYPVGAKLIGESNCTPRQAAQAFSFCSTASPMFLTATTAAMLGAKAAAIVTLCHVAACVLNGLLYRKKGGEMVFRSYSESFGNKVTSACLSVLCVGGLIALFYMLSDILRDLLPTADTLSLCLLSGMLEMTNGIISVCNVAEQKTAVTACCFFTSFGGACVIAQSLALLNGKVRASALILRKFTQGCIAAALGALCAFTLL